MGTNVADRLTSARKKLEQLGGGLQYPYLYWTFYEMDSTGGTKVD